MYPTGRSQIKRTIIARKVAIANSKDHAGKFRFHLKAPNGEIRNRGQLSESHGLAPVSKKLR
jgi:hypothetical protein